MAQRPRKLFHGYYNPPPVKPNQRTTAIPGQAHEGRLETMNKAIEKRHRKAARLANLHKNEEA